MCKKYLDKWMLALQRDSYITLDSWNELQSSYKETFGHSFIRRKLK